MQLKFVLVGIALFIVFFLPALAVACSCGGGGTPCEEFGKAAVVFVGTVVDVTIRPRMDRDAARKAADAGEYLPPRSFRFAVEQVFPDTYHPRPADRICETRHPENQVSTQA